MKLGKIIVFDGVDGSGKTSNADALADLINSKLRPLMSCDGVAIPAAMRLREPGTTPTGEAIRDILLSNKSRMPVETELLLFLASRAALMTEAKKLLELGAILIFDRFTDSTIAYQGRARGVDVGLISSLNDFVTYGLEPDLVILLDATFEQSVARRNAAGKSVPDRMEEELSKQFDVIRESFLVDAARLPCRVVIPTSNSSQESVFEMVTQLAARHIPELA